MTSSLLYFSINHLLQISPDVQSSYSNNNEHMGLQEVWGHFF